jgi:predicted Zn-dependent peptidase
MNQRYQAFTTHELNGLPVHLCSTQKFKTNHLFLYFRQPLEEATHTTTALIPSLLLRGTEHYPSSQKLKQALNELYGASLHSDVLKKGEQQVILFRLEIANEKYLKDQTPLLAQGIKLLHEVVTHPFLDKGSFHRPFVELEKDLLHKKLKRIKDDKTAYANKRCIEEMFKTEPFRLYSQGSIEQIEKITPEGLFKSYQHILMQQPIDLFVVGDVQEAQLLQSLEVHFNLPHRVTTKLPAVTSVDHPPILEKEVIEKTKTAQGKLHIGCRTNIGYADTDMIALSLFNGIFGGFAHSKLFREVREKQSLAYYVASRVEYHKGFMMIMAGIDVKNKDKTVSIIKAELEKMVSGEISDQELTQTKAMLINDLKEANDSPYRLVERQHHSIVGQKQYEMNQTIEALKQLSKEDVQQVARKIEIDTIYFLTAEESGGEQ